jgi:hypothetical protein
MKSTLRDKQVKTIRDMQQKLRAYIIWKKCGSKAMFFTEEDLDNCIFHLETIRETTEEPKVATKANKLLKLYRRIDKYEFGNSSTIGY